MVNEHEDFTDPKQHKKRTKAYKLREAKENEDLSIVLNTQQGVVCYGELWINQSY